MRLKKALMIKAGGGMQGEFATTANLTRQPCSVTMAISAMSASLIAPKRARNEAAQHTETPPTLNLFGQCDAQRPAPVSGAGAAEAEKDQEAEK